MVSSVRVLKVSKLVSYVVVPGVLLACTGTPRAPASPPSVALPGPPVSHAAATLAGTAVYDDGAPAAGAWIAATNLKTGTRDAVLVSDGTGHFEAALSPGSYVLAVTTERGFAWIEEQVVPNMNAAIKLTRECNPLTGQAIVRQLATRVELSRISKWHGDVFVTDPHADGTFSLCLPDARYVATLSGGTLSLGTVVTLPTTTRLRLAGFAKRDIEQPPPAAHKLPADLARVVADIVRSGAQLVGLGEATHGTAEFVPIRGDLTFELIRHADLRALLFEFDAIAAAQLDDYINGGDVDISKALPALGFWITDTYEFTRFLEQLREYNASTSDRVRLWGVDVQNTALPVELLRANAAALSIPADEQDLLQRVGPNRGKPVGELTAVQRAKLDHTLSRLSTPRSASLDDVRIAIAARSLAIQLAYWDGDATALYSERRDAGMASLAQFIVAQTGVKRACLWAHDGHVTKQWSVSTCSRGRHAHGMRPVRSASSPIQYPPRRRTPSRVR
jgi:hypothetical protein